VNSKRKISIEVFEDHDKVTFYSIRIDSNKDLETDSFFDKTFNYKKFEEDIGIISKMIDKIGENGAKTRNFRNAGTRSDGVGSLPEYLYSSKLRLYAIHLNSKIVILGNGGLKSTKAYNDDPYLNDCVEVLRELDRHLKSRIKKGTVVVYENQLMGNLNFTLLQ
tara:strand:- start:123387 stop:123878 length:492 start_codon:yes stop_codon:yes gene_type:complete